LSPEVERVNHPDSNQELDGKIEQTNGDDDDPSPTSSSKHSKDSTSNLSLQRIPKSKNRKVMLSNNVKNLKSLDGESVKEFKDYFKTLQISGFNNTALELISQELITTIRQKLIALTPLDQKVPNIYDMDSDDFLDFLERAYPVLWTTGLNTIDSQLRGQPETVEHFLH
jgi:hypothetical protein